MTSPWTTRTFGLSGVEWATSAVAAVVSSTLYVRDGYAYLALGVVGDLAGFLALAVVGLALGRRLRHEALLCLLAIAVVLVLDPAWPLRLPESAWWALFTVGLVLYVAVRRRLCGDHAVRRRG